MGKRALGLEVAMERGSCLQVGNEELKAGLAEELQWMDHEVHLEPVVEGNLLSRRQLCQHLQQVEMGS